METLYGIGSVVFGDWKIIREIGHGSYGRVYVIEKQDAFSRGVRSALKIIKIPPDSYSEGDGEFLTKDEKETFFRSCVEKTAKEIEAMTKLRGEIYIVRHEDHQINRGSDGRWYILIRMELMAESLSEVIKERGSLPEDEMIRIGTDISRALEACERNDIMHRDIKLANILQDEYGTYKLSDFGVARVLEGSTRAGTFSGTPNYMAPEMYRGEKYGHTVDIYSLGIVLYRLANGNRYPFYPPAGQLMTHEEAERAHERRLKGEPLPPPAGASPEFSRIILKACAYKPEDRYHSAVELRRDLERLADHRVTRPVTEESADTAVFPQTDEKGSAIQSSEDDKTERAEQGVTEINRVRPNPEEADGKEVNFEKIKSEEANRKEGNLEESKSEEEADSKGANLEESGGDGEAGGKPSPIESSIKLPDSKKPDSGESGPAVPVDHPPVQNSKNKILAGLLTIIILLVVGIIVFLFVNGKGTLLSGTDEGGVKPGDILKFGTYEQDNNTSNGKEEIEWIVLDVEDGKALVISKYGLDAMPYNNVRESITWEKCSLRKWLNETFFDEAFIDEERRRIQKTTVAADKNPKYCTDPGNDTVDQVFLLSITEAEKYFRMDAERVCDATVHADAHDAYKNNGHCWWWLRSPGYVGNYVAYVYYGGGIDYNGLYVDVNSIVVRPTLYIDLES